MSYLDNLVDGEEIFLRARRTKWIFTDCVVYALLFIIYVICFYSCNWFPKLDNNIRALIAFGPIIIPVYFLIYDLFSYIFLQVIITNVRILGKRGIIRLTVLNIPLNRATDMKVELSIVGRLLKFGTITLYTPGGQFVYKKITDPIKIKSTANKIQMQNTASAKTGLTDNTPTS